MTITRIYKECTSFSYMIIDYVQLLKYLIDIYEVEEIDGNCFVKCKGRIVFPVNVIDFHILSIPLINFCKISLC